MFWSIYNFHTFTMKSCNYVSATPPLRLPQTIGLIFNFSIYYLSFAISGPTIDWGSQQFEKTYS